jgi:hypothetical protein
MTVTFRSKAKFHCCLSPKLENWNKINYFKHHHHLKLGLQSNSNL